MPWSVCQNHCVAFAGFITKRLLSSDNPKGNGHVVLEMGRWLRDGVGSSQENSLSALALLTELSTPLGKYLENVLACFLLLPCLFLNSQPKSQFLHFQPALAECQTTRGSQLYSSHSVSVRGNHRQKMLPLRIAWPAFDIPRPPLIFSFLLLVAGNIMKHLLPTSVRPFQALP